MTAEHRRTKAQHQRGHGLLALIGGWFGLLLMASLGWLVVALTSYHGAADTADAALIIFGPAAVSAALAFGAFAAWFGRRPQLAAGVVAASMMGAAALIFFGIGSLA
jgi:hypothetical protein